MLSLWRGRPLGQVLTTVGDITGFAVPELGAPGGKVWLPSLALVLNVLLE